MAPAGALLLMLEVEFPLMLVAPALAASTDRQRQAVVAGHPRGLVSLAAAGAEEAHRFSSFGVQHAKSQENVRWQGSQ